MMWLMGKRPALRRAWRRHRYLAKPQFLMLVLLVVVLPTVAFVAALAVVGVIP